MADKSEMTKEIGTGPSFWDYYNYAGGGDKTKRYDEWFKQQYEPWYREQFPKLQGMSGDRFGTVEEQLKKQYTQMQGSRNQWGASSQTAQNKFDPKTSQGLLNTLDSQTRGFENDIPFIAKEQSRLYSDMVKNQTYDAMAGVKSDFRRNNVLAGSGAVEKVGGRASTEALGNITKAVTYDIPNQLQGILADRKQSVARAGLEIASMNMQQSQTYLANLIDDMKMRNTSISQLFTGLGTLGGYYMGSQTGTSTKTAGQ